RGLVVGRDEPEALVVAEPLDGSGRHLCFLLPLACPTRRLLQGRTATASMPAVGRPVQPGWYPLQRPGCALLERTIRARARRRAGGRAENGTNWEYAAAERPTPRLFLLLEYEPMVVQQLSLEADLVRAHPGGEREPEVSASDPTREERQLEQVL